LDFLVHRDVAALPAAPRTLDAQHVELALNIAEYEVGSRQRAPMLLRWVMRIAQRIHDDAPKLAPPRKPRGLLFCDCPN